MNQITFGYIDDCPCCLDGSVYPEIKGECCCKCIHHKKVTAHCCNVAHEPPMSCNCGEEMGFYICSVFDDMDKNGEVRISGLHGLCECFSERKEKGN